MNQDYFNDLPTTVTTAPQATKTAKTDERFFKLKRDADENGYALVRFLPDMNRNTFVEVFKYQLQSVVGGKKRFIDILAPSTINMEDPIQEIWSEHWNAGLKEEAKKFMRKRRIIAQIKVISDLNNPENDGKIFLYEMSQKLYEKIKSCTEQTAFDIKHNKPPKNLFNPLHGHSFILRASLGSNGFVNYDNSTINTDCDGIYGSIEEALDDIQNNGYDLGEFLHESSYPTKSEVIDKLTWLYPDLVDRFSETPKVQQQFGAVSNDQINDLLSGETTQITKTDENVQTVNTTVEQSVSQPVTQDSEPTSQSDDIMKQIEELKRQLGNS